VDWQLFTLVNGLAERWPAVDAVMTAATELGPFVYAGLLVVAWMASRDRPGHDSRTYRITLLRAALSGLLAVLVNWVFSAAYYRPRPFVARPAEVRLLLPHAPDSSFPSDHVALGAAVTAGAWPVAKRWLNVVFSVWTVLVAVSRVFVGHHYPSDVLAGLVIGSGSAWAVSAIQGWLDPLLGQAVDLWQRLWPRG